jgi:hypothetical protein
MTKRAAVMPRRVLVDRPSDPDRATTACQSPTGELQAKGR